MVALYQYVTGNITVYCHTQTTHGVVNIVSGFTFTKVMHNIYIIVVLYQELSSCTCLFMLSSRVLVLHILGVLHLKLRRVLGEAEYTKR